MPAYIRIIDCFNVETYWMLNPSIVVDNDIMLTQGHLLNVNGHWKLYVQCYFDVKKLQHKNNECASLLMVVPHGQVHSKFVSII
jgi:hypothetical protein